MSAEILARTLSSAPEIVEGIRSGLYQVWGGVVRYAAGHPKGGQIVAHLQFPSNAEQASEQIARLQEALGGAQESLGVLQNLQYANVALSGLNLAVSVAGFAIVCKKLNGISEQLTQQSEKLDMLIEMARDAKAREEMRDNASFSSVLWTVQQSGEQGDLQGLRSQVREIRDQYEITKLTLNRAAAGATGKDFVASLSVLQSLQQRMMYLGFLQAYVQQRTAGEKYAIRVLQELQADWLQMNTVIIKSIAANQEWIEQLTQEAGDNIISFLEYRKTAAPAIEYQTSMLEFTASYPQAVALLNEDVSEIRFLAA
ncbi:hypothetical protein HMPREF1487_09096 [Pseudomonas sp. HPB0071]|uniref:hypothetical protein n=1 Tax=unclassified Pseudomonas TaxID=196821 RepID=UPI0002CAADE0|nr:MULTISPECIES: hypothetical protein [unclassified Pseudomonas]ENA27913.1 hypothetical protein HMPREF1487_09096 [Pseudomonas sp. HPB0071]